MLNSTAPDVIAAFEENARLHHRIGGTSFPFLTPNPRTPQLIAHSPEPMAGS